MFDVAELLDDQEYDDIKQDCKDECGKYGTVLDIKIPRPIVNTLGKIDGRASEAVHGLGRIFVKFDAIESATKAIGALGGRQVRCSTYSMRADGQRSPLESSSLRTPRTASFRRSEARESSTMCTVYCHATCSCPRLRPCCY